MGRARDRIFRDPQTRGKKSQLVVGPPTQNHRALLSIGADRLHHHQALGFLVFELACQGGHGVYSARGGNQHHRITQF